MQNQQPCANSKTFHPWHFALGLLLVLGYLAVRPAKVEAATLYLAPSSGQVTVGKTLSVNVNVASPDQAVNAMSGRVAFPRDQLTFTGSSKSGSVISLWVQEPAEQADGTVRFEGIVLNPGYTGSAGRVVTLTFKAKAAGSASLTFASGSVLANDGKGTNVLSGLGSATFAVAPSAVGPQPGEATSPVESAGVPLAPRVSSATHPDPNKWYTSNTPTFTWALSADITGVNVLADHEPTTNPGTSSDGLRSSYTYQNVDDGTWYFHIRLRNSRGWGAVTHFRFQIDTQNPNPLTITFADGLKTADPTPDVVFKATDDQSGIDVYRVKIGDDNFVTVPAASVGDSPYTLPPQKPGPHTILVQAVDRAGNYVTASKDFEITPLDAPQLTDYPTELAPNDSLVVKGKTYPRATVHLVLIPESGAQTQQDSTSDNQGNFTVIWPKKLAVASYQFTVAVEDSRGARSLPTAPRAVLVQERPLIHLGQLAVSYMSLIVTFASLLLSLMVVASYGFIKVRQLRRRLRREVSAVEQVLHKSFKSLRTDLKSQLRLLERARTKRELTLEEEKISGQLQKALDTAESLVSREIEEIEREVDT